MLIQFYFQWAQMTLNNISTNSSGLKALDIYWPVFLVNVLKKYELEFYLPRAPSLVKFYLILVIFISHGTENTKKIFTQDLKLQRKIWARFFRFYIVFNRISQ